MFQRFLELDGSTFGELSSEILALNAVPSVAEFRDRLIRSGQSDELVEWMTDFLLAIGSIGIRTSEPIQEVLAGLQRDLERQNPDWWNESEWKEKLPRLAGLVGPDTSVTLLSKASALSSLSPGSVLNTRIFTETRWIFSDSGDNVMGALTKHVLVIASVDGIGNDTNQSFVLDDSDLEKLIAQAERARRKAEAIASLTNTTSTVTFETR
ncbi:MAG: hypothetical protein JST35_03310 [Armatimonadetes bacterium]|nr:hypothetical protein [Armatimonadota bacterium]